MDRSLPEWRHQLRRYPVRCQHVIAGGRLHPHKLILSRYLAEWQYLHGVFAAVKCLQKDVLKCTAAPDIRQRLFELIKALLVGHRAVNVDDVASVRAVVVVELSEFFSRRGQISRQYSF